MGNPSAPKAVVCFDTCVSLEERADVHVTMRNFCCSDDDFALLVISLGLGAALSDFHGNRLGSRKDYCLSAIVSCMMLHQGFFFFFF